MLTQTLPAPPPAAGVVDVPPGSVGRLPVCVPVVGVCAFGIVAGVDFGNVCAGIVAGAGVALGDVLLDVVVVVFDVSAYHSLTPLWPRQAPFLLSLVEYVPSLQRPVASAGRVPVAAVEVVDVVSLLDEVVAAGVDAVVFAVDLAVDVLLVDELLLDASAAPYHSFTP